MSHRNRRFRSLDPLLILALVVGIGVVLTTTVQARSPGEVPEPILVNLPEQSSQTWFSRIMDDVGSVIGQTEEDTLSAAGSGKIVPEEGLSWHLKAAHNQSAAANTLEPEVRFGVSYSW